MNGNKICHLYLYPLKSSVYYFILKALKHFQDVAMYIISVSYAAGIFLHKKYFDLIGLATSIKNTIGNSDHKNRADLNLAKPTYHRSLTH